MRRSLAAAVLLPAALLVLERPAGATFHVVSISEIGAGVGGNPAVQFVEVRMDGAGQNLVRNTRLTAFDASGAATVLVLTDGNVANAAAGSTVLYATAAFAAATGVTPDFTMPEGIATPTGMVCWGAPGASAPDPDTWDPAVPDNYVDCVAYGDYAAATRIASGTPTSLRPGDGARSLARTQGTSDFGSNAADFALEPPNVCTNAGTCTDLGGRGTVCGDADGNGAVTLTDGVQTLRAAAGLSNTCTAARCDVDGNGAVSLTDGVQVLRAAAGLPITGTCTAAG